MTAPLTDHELAQLRKWVVSIVAMRMNANVRESRHDIRVIWALSRDDAQMAGLGLAALAWPPDHGWTEHGAVATNICEYGAVATNI